MNIELIKEKVRLVKLSHEGKSIIEIFRDLNFVIGYLDNNYPYINETKGCNIKTTKLRAVLLNPNLCENELIEVLTHELGHVYVHPNINTFKIHEIDPVWVKHLELEADTFASEYITAAQKHSATSCSNWYLPTARVYPRLTVKSRKKQKSCDNSRPDEPFPIRAVSI